MNLKPPNAQISQEGAADPQETGSSEPRSNEVPFGAPVSTDVEAKLADIWSDLLAIRHVDRAANFFDLGGNSLHIVRMRERLRRIGLTVDVTSVYNDATLWRLALKVRADDRAMPSLMKHNKIGQISSDEYDEGVI